MNSKKHILRAEQIFNRANRSLRDNYLECGRHLHLFILRAMEEHDSASDYYEKHGGDKREHLILAAANRLQTKTQNILRMIRAAMVVELLSDDGHIGDLSYSSIARMSCLIRRKPASPGASVGAWSKLNRHLPYISLETYEPKRKDAENVFRQAVSENWSLEKTISETVSARKSNKSPVVSEESSRADLENQILKASPGDAAELIYRLISKTRDPYMLASRLRVMLLSLENTVPFKLREAM